MLRFIPVCIGALVLVGCATVDPSACGRFDQARQSLRYDTLYRYSDVDTRQALQRFKPMRQTQPAAVHWYTVRVNTPEIQPCDHLYLYKELYLQRQAGNGIRIEETREFYTAGGKRIAMRRETVTSQLKNGGYYTAAVPLPIPETAPSGVYKVVSRLTLRKNGGKETVLASASTEFRVVH